MPEETPKEQPTQEEPEAAAGDKPKEKVSFPWLMFFVAVFFDLIGLIPIVNIFSEIFAGLAFGFWQKIYAPKTDPVLTFIVAKIADAIFLGMLPSNIAIVVFAYIKKKLEEKKEALLKLSQTRLGKYAANKFSGQPA
ncbi:hypothetical protein KJ853_03210 [Patescibacteria group bacterium]|nr:hypothetical protein [Patescibacteria group bacterium]